MPRPMTQGTKLADRMQALGYSVTDTAQGTGLSRFTLNDYLNQRYPIPPRQLNRLARFLHCQPEVIHD